MRAVVVNEFGGPEAMTVQEVAAPVPLPTEVLVRVRAVGLNPVERYVVSGAFPVQRPPFTPGWDIAGVVEQVVPGVSRFAVGDEVMGMPFFPRPAGAYAELVAAPSRQLARKPASLDWAAAASLPLAGLTAWQSLVDVANVQPGQRVLVHAAGGGVGHLAVQIAKARGAYVIGTASASKHGLLSELGIDEAIDYRSADFAQAVRDVDVVLEPVGGGYAERSIGVLREGGLLVTLVERTNAELAAKVRQAGRRFAGVTVEPDYPALEALAALVEQGRLHVHVSATYALADAPKAHAAFARGVMGKTALVL